MATAYNFAAPPEPSRKPVPGGGERSADKPAQPQQAPSGGDGPQARAGEQLTVLTSNYSVAPGPAWLMATNKAAITVSSTAVRLDLPNRGSGFFLRDLTNPIVAFVLPPAGPPDRGARFGDEAHEPKPPDWEWWPPLAWQPVASATSAELHDPEKAKEELQAAQDKEKQKEEEKKKQQEQQAKQTPEQQQKEQEQRQKQMQEDRTEGRATPPPGTVDEWMQITGMSTKGFPGYPRAIKNVNTPPGLPTTAGINRAVIDKTTDPPELSVHLVGSGTIPKDSRWLFFTLVGIGN